MHNPKYSFILPAYKHRFFKDAIDSILNQTYEDFELVIVNDASPEDLNSVVAGYNDNRIRYYINEYNIGGKDLVAQWNHSLKYARGEYVILASDDDVYAAEYLEVLDEMVNKYPEVNVFRPRIQVINELGEILHVESYLKEYSTILEFAYSWSHGYIKSGIPFYLFKKKELLRIGGFFSLPLAWFSDDATVISMAGNGVVTVPEILFAFRCSGDNISTRQNDKDSLLSKLEATIEFYAWFEEEISKFNSVNCYDIFYKKNILNNISNGKNGHLMYVLGRSELAAIFSVTYKILHNRILPIRLLLLVYYKKISQIFRR